MTIWSRILIVGIVPYCFAFTPFNNRTFYIWPDSSTTLEILDTAAFGSGDSAVTTQPVFSATAPLDSALLPKESSAAQRVPVQDSGAAPPPDDTATVAGDSAAEVYDLPAMVVRPPKKRRSAEPYAQSSVKISAAQIKQRAGTVEDISRYLGTLPSAVSSIGAGYDNTLFVRGGRPDEIIYVVDGIELENINHFSQANGSGGPIGFINSENVKSLQFYSGAIPVAFPSRLSSVVSVDMNNGSLYDSRLSLGCKMTGGMLSAEGPLANGKSSFTLAGRYVDFSAFHSYVKNFGIPKVADLFGKIFVVGSDAVDLSATGILSWNHYRFFYPSVELSYDGIPYGNEKNDIDRILQGGGGVKLRYVKGNAIHEARLAVSFRKGSTADSLSSLDDPFFSNRYAANPIWSEQDNRLHYQMNASSSFSLTDHQQLSLGIRAGINRYGFSERNDSNYVGKCIICEETGPDTVIVKHEPKQKSVSFYGMEPGLFLEYTGSSRLLRFSAGLRADYFNLLEDAAVSPRLSLAITPQKTGSFSLAGGLYHQFPMEVPTLAFALLPFKAPADTLADIERRYLRQADPQRCWQSSLGYDRFMGRDHELRVETYYKWYDREYGYAIADTQLFFDRDKNGALILHNQNGKRRAIGIEGSLSNHDAQRFFYSLNGSVFDIKNKYDDGSWQNDWTNVGFTYVLSCGARLFGSHSVSLSIQGSGGRPFCPKKIVPDCINRKIALLEADVPYFSRRLERLMYASMRYSFLRRGSRAQTEGFIEVLNLLDYTPTLEYKWNGAWFVEVKPFRITPILGVKVNW